jgi:hypothetical protein
VSEPFVELRARLRDLNNRIRRALLLEIRTLQLSPTMATSGRPTYHLTMEMGNRGLCSVGARRESCRVSNQART